MRFIRFRGFFPVLFPCVIKPEVRRKLVHFNDVVPPLCRRPGEVLAGGQETLVGRLLFRQHCEEAVVLLLQVKVQEEAAGEAAVADGAGVAVDSVVVGLAVQQLPEGRLTTRCLTVKLVEVFVKKFFHIFRHKECWAVDFGNDVALAKIWIARLPDFDTHFCHVGPNIEFPHIEFSNITKVT